MSKIGKRAMLLLLALPIGFNVMAQETKKPTLEELIPGGESYRYADNLYGLQWWGDECIKPGVDTLYSIQPKTGKETMVITREQINKVLEETVAITEAVIEPIKTASYKKKGKGDISNVKNKKGMFSL